MLETSTKQEYWLSGSIDGVPALLQPVAHALLQAKDEITDALVAMDADKVWDRLNGMASVGFHVKHITGVLDRLFTYAGNEGLSAEQLTYLSLEGQQVNGETTQDLLTRLSLQVNKSIEYLKTVESAALTEAREVGRKKIPSTVLGLLFHAAEHTMRHCGQLLVTARIVGE